MDIGVFGVYMCLFLALYFEVFLLISFLEKRPVKQTAALPQRYPTVCMIVPCYNEEKTIAKTLQSLLNLEYPKDKLTISVVDDGSKDNTGAIAKDFAAKYPQVLYSYKTNGGKYTALNVGIERTDAELVGCLDADSFVLPNGLIEMVKAFEQNPSAMATTPVMKVFQPKGVLQRMQAVEYTLGVFYKKMFDNLSAINVLPGPFSLYRRSVFNQIGLFRHAHNTEDMEITFRMHAHKLKIINVHSAVVHTTAPSTMRALIKQRTRWSQGFLQNARDYSYMFFNRKFGDFGLLVLPFSALAFGASIYMVVYILFRLVSSITEKIIDISATGIPLHIPALPHFGWFFLDTSMMTFLIMTVLVLTLVAILLGQNISKTPLTIKSFFSYFVLFGFVAPIWLARAVWGAALARESTWR